MAAGNGEGGDGEAERAAASPGPAGYRSAEKALEEAACSGSLVLSGRRLRDVPSRSQDLSDVTRADLSRNRFSEIPGDICQLVSLEFLNLYHNCVRSVPPAISNLQALTYLNLSRNLLSSLPPYLCRLPLTVLIASNNRLTSLPEELGSLTNLRQLDVSCNELQTLPSQMGSMESLRELNVRRNQLSALPEELSGLPLTRLDFSCNRVTRIPVCYRHLRHLQSVLLDNNPLQYPPAQICLKGKVHIFKHLNIGACNKPVSESGMFDKLSRPTSFTTGLTDDLYSGRPYGCLDSGFNSVDSGSKRWSGNESADEFSDLSLRIAGLGRHVRERRDGAEGDAEHTDFIDSSADEDMASDCGLHMNVTPQDIRPGEKHSTPRTEETIICRPIPSPPSPTARDETPTEERRRPETLLIWRERERQQQQQQQQQAARRASLGRKGSISSDNCAQNLRPALRNQCPQTAIPSLSSPTSPCSDPSLGSAPKPNSFLFRSFSRGAVRNAAGSDAAEPGVSERCSPVRLRSARPPPDEKTLLTQLSKEIESRLNVSLGEPPGDALADGVVLCQLVNQLRPRSIPCVHVPSPAVPKLNPVKCRRNVDSFLDACRRIGVPERDLCLPSDILGGEHPLIVLRTVSPLLLLPPEAAASPHPPPSPLPHGAARCSPRPFILPSSIGFLLFYVLLMLTLYAAYRKVCVL